MSYKKGDIVFCYDNGKLPDYVNPLYVGVRVPDMSMEEGLSLLEPIMSMDIVTGEQIMTVRRRFFCAENIAPDNVTEFYRCVAANTPYTTDRLSFLSYAVEIK